MLEPHIILISPNTGQIMGGEAIKSYQFFLELSKKHKNISLVTHARCREQLSHLMSNLDIHLIEDDIIFKILWNVRVLNLLVAPYFFWKLRAILPSISDPGEGNIIHYICPISPIYPRFPISGYRTILGPLNGRVDFPEGFKNRQGFRSRYINTLQNFAQKCLKMMLGEKKKFDVVLVSGCERTRASLCLAGCPEEKMVDVVDAGVAMVAPRLSHKGINRRFMCSGRLINYKGIDLAIKAVAQAQTLVSLDVFGEGVCGLELEKLAIDLGVTDRVTFHGWCNHEELLVRMREYRGYLFPTLAEANGIVMQEAMMAGLPVITLRWGGPDRLADDSSAHFIEPIDEAHVIRELARAMTKFSNQPEHAEEISRNARAIAEEKFTWDAVLKSWVRHYT